MANDGTVKIGAVIDEQGFKSSLSKLGGVAKGALGGITAAIGAAGAAMGGFAAAAVKTGMAFDSTMSGVAAISGAVGQEFDDLRAKALEMGAKTKFSASEAAEAMTYMGMAGWKAEDMLTSLSGVMDLAAASGEDLATVSDIVTDAMTAFGMSASGYTEAGIANAAHFADVLAVAASNANTNVGMMGETFKYVAPLAGALNYSIEDTSLAIGLMANSGIKASQAGTALRSIFTRLSTDAGASSKSLGALGTLTEKLGVAFYKADGSTRALNDVINDSRAAWAGLTEQEQISYATTIAGQEAMSGWLALMNAAPADVEKLTESLNNADGAAKEMAATMQDNLQGDLTLLGSAFESLQIAVSDKLTPSLREGTQMVTGFVEELLEAVNNGGLEGLVEKAGDILAQILLELANQLPKFIEMGAGLLQSLINGLMENLPTLGESALRIIEALLSGLITIAPQLLTAGWELAAYIARGILEAIPSIADSALELAKTFGEGFQESAPEMWDSINGFIFDLLKTIIENAPKFLEAGAEILSSLLQGFLDYLPTLLEQIPGMISELAAALVENLPKMAEMGGDLLKSLIDGLVSAIPILVEALPDIIDAVVSFLSEVGPVIIASGAEILFSLISGIIGAIPTLVEALPQIVDAIANGILNLLGNIVDLGAQIVSALWDGIVDGVKNFFGGGSGRASGGSGRAAAGAVPAAVSELDEEGGASTYGLTRSRALASLEAAIPGAQARAAIVTAGMAPSAAYAPPSGGIGGGWDREGQTPDIIVRPNITLRFDGDLAQLAQVLKPSLDAEDARVGHGVR